MRNILRGACARACVRIVVAKHGELLSDASRVMKQRVTLRLDGILTHASTNRVLKNVEERQR